MTNAPATVEEIRKLAHEVGLPLRPMLQNWSGCLDYPKGSKYEGQYFSYIIQERNCPGDPLIGVWLVRGQVEGVESPVRFTEIYLADPTLDKVRAGLTLAEWP